MRELRREARRERGHPCPERRPWCGSLPGPAKIIDEVPAGRLYRDGAIITRADDGQVRERRKLSFAGSVSVSLVMSDKGVLLADPEVALSGVPGTDRRRHALETIARDAASAPSKAFPSRAAKIRPWSARPSAAASAPPSIRPGARSPCARCC